MDSIITLALTIVEFILALGVLMFLHESGHYLGCLLFKIPVEEFGIGLPPRIIRLAKINETEFTLNWIPFGAFVRPKGEADISVPGGFSSVNPFKRLVVLLGGPFMNLLTAVVLFSVIYTQTGIPDAKRIQIVEVSAGSPAETAGLLPGDIITQINTQAITGSKALSSTVEANKGKEITMMLEREGKMLEVKLTPRTDPPQGQGPLGIMMGNPVVKRSFLQVMPIAASVTLEQGIQLIQLPGRLIQGSIKPEEARVVGPIGMFSIYEAAKERDQADATAPQAAQSSGLNTLALIAIISAALGFTNLLPIPALDGGRILFLLPELIIRKRIPEKYENMVNLIGFAALLFLMFAITAQDILNPIVIP